MIESLIRDRLLSLGPVTALVVDRVFMLRVQQGATMPAVRVQEIDEDAPKHWRGPVGFVKTRIQVDAFAKTYAEAQALASAIHGDGLGPNATGLDGFMGELGGSPATARVHCVDRALRRTGFEPDELRLVRIQQDYMVEWTALE